MQLLLPVTKRNHKVISQINYIYSLTKLIDNFIVVNQVLWHSVFIRRKYTMKAEKHFDRLSQEERQAAVQCSCAINFVTKKAHTVTNATYITAIEICQMLKTVAAEYPGKKIPVSEMQIGYLARKGACDRADISSAVQSEP